MLHDSTLSRRSFLKTQISAGLYGYLKSIIPNFVAPVTPSPHLDLLEELYGLGIKIRNARIDERDIASNIVFGREAQSLSSYDALSSTRKKN